MRYKMMQIYEARKRAIVFVTGTIFVVILIGSIYSYSHANQLLQSKHEGMTVNYQTCSKLYKKCSYNLERCWSDKEHASNTAKKLKDELNTEKENLQESQNSLESTSRKLASANKFYATVADLMEGVSGDSTPERTVEEVTPKMVATLMTSLHELKQIKLDHEDLKTEHTAIIDELARIKESEAKALREVADLRDSKDDLQAILDNRKDEEKTLLGKLDSLSKTVKGLQDEKTSLIEEKTSLAEDKTSLTNDKTSLIKVKEILSNKIENLQSELADKEILSKKNLDLEKELVDKEFLLNKIQKLESELLDKENLSRMVIDLQNKLTKWTSKRKSMKKKKMKKEKHTNSINAVVTNSPDIIKQENPVETNSLKEILIPSTTLQPKINHDITTAPELQMQVNEPDSTIEKPLEADGQDIQTITEPNKPAEDIQIRSIQDISDIHPDDTSINEEAVDAPVNNSEDAQSDSKPEIKTETQVEDTQIASDSIKDPEVKNSSSPEEKSVESSSNEPDQHVSEAEELQQAETSES